MIRCTRVLFILFLTAFAAGKAHPDNSYKSIMNKYHEKFIEALRYGNLQVMIRILEASFDEGGIPDWLIQYN